MKSNISGLFIVIFGFVLFSYSCAPVFSELQSARTVGKNKFEATPSYSYITYSEEGETDGLQNHIGTQAAYGISAKFDIRLRYEYIWLKDDDFTGGTHVLGIGPKFALLENIIAFSLPVGRAFGEDTQETWEMHPTFLFTLPAVKDKLDITLAPKYLLTFCDDCIDYIAINLGFALGKDVTRWAVRPEYGLLFPLGESGCFSHFSLGFTYVFGK